MRGEWGTLRSPSDQITQEQNQMAYQREPGSPYDHDLSRAAQIDRLWTGRSIRVAVALMLAFGALIFASLSWNAENTGPATRTVATEPVR